MLSLRSNIFSYAERVFAGKDFVSFLLKTLFFPISICWSVAVFLKNFLYASGIRKSKAVSAKVISIGNVTCGGTGKTPLILFLTRALQQKGKTVAILSRGYRSKAEKKRKPLYACQGNGPLFSWRKMGDEPYLLAKKLKTIHLFVGKNRLFSAKQAEKRASFILLDDGLQYRKLHRDYEIVTIDRDRSLEDELYLPCGYLRDSLARLKEASLLVLRPIFNEEEARVLEEKLRKFTSAPVVGMEPVFQVKNQQQVEILSLRGVAVGVFCGIAKPEGFLSTLLKMGLEIKDSYIASDHSEIPVKEFSERCLKKGAKYLICTEKDLVKVENEKLSLPIIYVEMDYRIIYGQSHWENLIEKMLNNQDNRTHI